MVRSASAPPGARLSTDSDPHTWVGLKVSYVVGHASVLGDYPGRVALQAVADGRCPRLPRAAPDRLEEGVAGRRDSQLEGGLDEGVEHQLLKRIDDATLHT